MNALAATVVACLVPACAAMTAVADDFRLASSSALDLHFDSAAQADSTTAPPVAAPRWGDENYVAVNITGGFAHDFNDTGLAPVTAGLSWFAIRNFSFDVQLEGAYVHQPGEDAYGGGAAFLLRWHFLDFGDWTIFGDMGVGFLLFSDPVPPGAAEFVFTPRAGGGVSIKIDDNTRLLAGLRWYHISNAQTADENPGINALQAYIGVSFGF